MSSAAKRMLGSSGSANAAAQKAWQSSAVNCPSDTPAATAHSSIALCSESESRSPGTVGAAPNLGSSGLPLVGPRAPVCHTFCYDIFHYIKCRNGMLQHQSGKVPCQYHVALCKLDK